MPDQSARRTEDAIARALKISRSIARGNDQRAREQIERFPSDPDYSQREFLCIAEDAWRQVAEAEVAPRLAFAHPNILQAIPDASLHYRGIALLSRKRVQEIAGSIDTWENSPHTARVSDEKALKVCRLFNAVISSIIVDNTNWTAADGYRNILATIGITEDGAIRNIIGQEAESAIKERLLRWVQTEGLLADANANVEEGRHDWALVDDVFMRFGSEPDIAFTKDGRLAVLIEIKGGKDPAGALERLGAIKKTFDEAPVDCKNFLIVGIVTPTMRTRLQQMRMERSFDIDRLLEDDGEWTGLMNEIFHHGLRIAPEAPTPE